MIVDRVMIVMLRPVLMCLLVSMLVDTFDAFDGVDAFDRFCCF